MAFLSLNKTALHPLSKLRISIWIDFRTMILFKSCEMISCLNQRIIHIMTSFQFSVNFSTSTAFECPPFCIFPFTSFLNHFTTISPDFGVDDLIDFKNQTKFPWLLSNVIDDISGDLLAEGLEKLLIEWQGKKVRFNWIFLSRMIWKMKLKDSIGSSN